MRNWSVITTLLKWNLYQTNAVIVHLKLILYKDVQFFHGYEINARSYTYFYIPTVLECIWRWQQGIIPRNLNFSDDNKKSHINWVAELFLAKVIWNRTQIHRLHQPQGSMIFFYPKTTKTNHEHEIPYGNTSVVLIILTTILTVSSRCSEKPILMTGILEWINPLVIMSSALRKRW